MAESAPFVVDDRRLAQMPGRNREMTDLEPVAGNPVRLTRFDVEEVRLVATTVLTRRSAAAGLQADRRRSAAMFTAVRTWKPRLS